MKNRILTSLLIVLVLSACPLRLSASSMAEINKVEIQPMCYSSQVRLNFSNSIDYKVDELNGACILSLHNVPYTSSAATNLAQNIKKSCSNIANVALSKLSSESPEKEGTQLTISFTHNNIHCNVRSFEHPHQLVIDVISNDLLQNKLNGNGVISQALNGLHAHYAAHSLV